MTPNEPQRNRSDGLRKWRTALILCLLGATLTLVLKPRSEPSASANDFAFYWTAARLVLDGRNPYSPQETVEIQNRLSFAGKGPLVMLNPPWILPVVVPFGLLSFSAAKACWFVIGLTLALISVPWLWELYAGRRDPWIGWLATVTFLPLAVVLAIGQVGPLLLFGLAGFLRFEARQRHVLAGACLFLASLKPHLVFLLWPALVLDALYRRRWKPLLGFVATLSSMSLLSLVLDSRAFQQYLALFTEHRLMLQETPTLGGLFRHLTGWEAMQFLPLAAAILWFAVYWLRQRAAWDWTSQTPMLLLVSVAVTSYAWFFDQVVLLPSVLQTTVLAVRSHRPVMVWAAIGYFAVNGVTLFFLLDRRSGFWYSWTAVAWLALAVMIRRKAIRSTEGFN